MLARWLCIDFVVLIVRRPPGSTRTDTRFPDPTRFRSDLGGGDPRASGGLHPLTRRPPCRYGLGSSLKATGYRDNGEANATRGPSRPDRKSTRLTSSH